MKEGDWMGRRECMHGSPACWMLERLRAGFQPDGRVACIAHHTQGGEEVALGILSRRGALQPETQWLAPRGQTTG